MRPPRVFARLAWLSATPTLILAAALAAGPDDRDRASKAAGDTPGEKDRAQIPIDVYEWSIWVGNPSQPTLNTARVYRNAMPNVVGTSRPKIEDRDLAARFPVAPVSVVQLFGEPRRDVDVDIRAKKGMFLSHWPASKELTGRLQWFGSELAAGPPAGIPQGYLPETHWLHTLRGAKDALYLKYESHYERFLAYDSELAVPVPVKLRGGPDEYTLQNLTRWRLRDVAVIAPVAGGIRVGWLDELPAAGAAQKDEETRKKDEADKADERKKAADPKGEAAQQKEKADALFRDAEEKKDPKEKGKDEPPLPPLPPEGDATVRARVDQLLNQPIRPALDRAPVRDLIRLITGEARLRYEIDDKGLAKEHVDLGQPGSLKGAGIAARDALADVLGNAGLSYRVTEEGRLFITTTGRLSEDLGKSGAVAEGPPVTLVMSPPRKADDPSYRELTRDALTRRLEGQGLRRDVARSLLDQYGPALFEPSELVVLAHLSREAIDEAVILDVFPPPRKLVRTVVVVVHGVDPRLQDRARTLVKQLGDPSYPAREAAESQLAVLGPVAVPALEDALSEKDVEIALRAERLLLKLHRPVP